MPRRLGAKFESGAVLPISFDPSRGLTSDASADETHTRVQRKFTARLTHTWRALTVATVAFLAFVAAGDQLAVAAQPDKKFLLEFLAGDYRLVGQEADSGAAYIGRVNLTEHDGGFEVKRTIGSATTTASGAIETAGEGTLVVRIRWKIGGVDYEATYLWHSDMDNYPRLTGYVYRKQGETRSPGLEALFHIPPAPEK